ncbi:mechanosensitive ion channel family protein [bacterium]|nr:mechanosensitive ion channel family protein [bacterium]
MNDGYMEKQYSLENLLQIQNVLKILKDKLSLWLKSFIELIPNILLAGLVFCFFYLLALGLRKISPKIFSKISSNLAINNLLQTTLHMLILILGLFVALSILNLDKAVTSLLAGAGVIGIALGFAFQETSANFISGVLIAFRKPYTYNDIVKVEDILGKVEAINLRSTILTTFDGQHVVIPNRIMFTNPLWNYTKTSNRRVDLLCGVAYDSDLDLVEDTVRHALQSIKDRDESKDIEFYYDAFADSSINFSARVWIKYPYKANYLLAKHQMVKNIKKAFDDKGIVIPFPIRTLDFPQGIQTKVSELKK